MSCRHSIRMLYELAGNAIYASCSSALVFPTGPGVLKAGRSSLGRTAGPTGRDMLVQGRGVDGGG